MSAAGFFGKIPTRGDFVERGLPRPLTDALEVWSKAGLATFADHRPQSWLQDYLVSPIWRFAGAFSGRVWAGVLCPSVDAAGRYFPIALVAEQSVDEGAETYFSDAEALARDALRPEGFDFSAWANRVSALRRPLSTSAEWRSGAVSRPVDGELFSTPSYADLLESVASETEIPL